MKYSAYELIYTYARMQTIYVNVQCRLDAHTLSRSCCLIVARLAYFSDTNVINHLLTIYLLNIIILKQQYRLEIHNFLGPSATIFRLYLIQYTTGLICCKQQVLSLICINEYQLYTVL